MSLLIKVGKGWLANTAQPLCLVSFHLYMDADCVHVCDYGLAVLSRKAQTEDQHTFVIDEVSTDQLKTLPHSSDAYLKGACMGFFIIQCLAACSCFWWKRKLEAERSNLTVKWWLSYSYINMSILPVGTVASIISDCSSNTVWCFRLQSLVLLAILVWTYSRFEGLNTACHCRPSHTDRDFVSYRTRIARQSWGF